jgi:orotate phosphoribosyltransferase
MKENEVLAAIRDGKIFNLTPEVFKKRRMTMAEVVAIFHYFGAFWQYEGEPCAQKPHALLKSGLHSNGFISCKDVLKYPRICTLFAEEVIKAIEEKLSFIFVRQQITAVASSAYSAINLGWEVARLVSNMGTRDNVIRCEYIPVEKDEKGNPTIIRGGIDPSRSVLIINELMTTGWGSTWETKKSVLNCNGENSPPQILEPAFVLVHRSKDLTLADDSSVEPVFHFDIENYEPEKCPFCKVGSEAIKPKVGDGTNWKRLHGLK